ncbi:cytoplasmic dynein 2 light intermediate chain 1 isoform X2 [Rhodnius prolixus]
MLLSHHGNGFCLVQASRSEVRYLGNYYLKTIFSIMDKELLLASLTSPIADTFLDKIIEKTENFIQKRLESERASQKSLFVIGSRTSGKTSFIIDVFGLNQEEIKPTLALDFFCAFHLPDEGYPRKVCNIWELAGGTNYGSVLMTVQAPSDLAAVIMLDLSRPNTLWQTATTCLEILRKYIEIKHKDCLSPDRVPENLKDKTFIKALPVPIFFVGGKYDLFQEFEPEKKRVICQFLRYLSHVNSGFLFFYSNKQSNLSKSAKEIMSNYAFDVPIKSQEQFEYNKPLWIAPGADSFEAIEGKVDMDLAPSMEKYRDLLNNYFPQDEQISKKYPNNPRFDSNFKEPSIDCMRKERDEALVEVIDEIEKVLRINHNEEDNNHLVELKNKLV